tara:strand:+ start:2391 stop:3245 length:855 start_codon:yes stop_codon:yes gene_type:complete
MNFIIPTYKRSHTILSHTLKLLERLNIPQKDIFVVVGCDDENDYNEYFYPINELYPSINILVGDNSNYKASQSNFIRTELLEDRQIACIIDDDIEDVLIKVNDKLEPITPDDFKKFYETGFNLMRGYNCEGLMGVNSTGNPFYMSDKVKLCKSCICGGLQFCFNEPELHLNINQGADAYESCWYLDKYGYNLKYDFITIKTKLFKEGGLFDYRKNISQTHNDYLSVALKYPKYLSYYTWNLGDDEGVDNHGNKVKIPKSRTNKLTIELKWLRSKSEVIRTYDDF